MAFFMAIIYSLVMYYKILVFNMLPINIYIIYTEFYVELLEFLLNAGDAYLTLGDA